MKLAVIVSVFIALLVIATIVDNTPTPTSIASKPAWTTYASKDEMTGARQAFAFSRNVTAITRMTFPYRDTEAWLGVGCDAQSEWGYIGFDHAPNLVDRQIQSGYNTLQLRVRWDDAVANTQSHRTIRATRSYTSLTIPSRLHSSLHTPPCV